MLKDKGLFAKVVNVTDLRYRWRKVAEDLEEDWPVLVLEHSTPKAVLFSYKQAQGMLSSSKKEEKRQDPLEAWRKKNLAKFAGWQATKVIRKMRNSRWNLS